MTRNPRPLFTALEAAQRAIALVGHSVYELGTGNADTPDDEPMDCCGFATCKVYGIIRHRPMFNRGSWSTVEDDINCNSSIEDAHHEQDLFDIVTDDPQLGDLIKWPTIHHPVTNEVLEWGHECIVIGVDRSIGKWDPTKPDYRLLDVAQCAGPNGRRPGILATDGTYWYEHSLKWPGSLQRSWLLRVKP